jgi:YYY domain-containing protein
MSFWEMAGYFLRWWASTTILALALWPIVYQCLKRLPDRGWAFARMAGILFTGYFFWLGAWLRVWQNVPGAVWICAGGLFLAGTVVARSRGEEPWGWLRAHPREALFTEAVFFVLLAGLTWIRAYDAGATHTERPMDLAFLNAIMRSEYFPPRDPWMSGYAISYYHFGYILTAMLAKMSGMTGDVAFSFGVTGSFSLAGLGAYGLLRNLLLLRAESGEPPAAGADQGESPASWRKAQSFWRSPALWLPLLAPFTLLFLGNFAGSLEILYTERVGWQGDQGPFWTALDINGYNVPPSSKSSVLPTRLGWWWWTASRVINDRDLDFVRCPPLGCPLYDDGLIDEFPAFSFVIGDMHPHVMALPFLLLAVAVALETLLRGGGALVETASDRRLFFGFTALSIGSLLFLNTWDILVFGMVMIAGWAGWKMSRRELLFRSFSGWKAFLARWALTGIVSVALFLPFLIGFSSQAGGILPNALFPTKGGQFFVMFGTLFTPLFAWLILEILLRGWKPDWRNGLTLAAGGLAVMLVGSLILAFYISLNPAAMALLGDVLGGFGTMDAMSIVLARRFTDPWATLLPLGLIAAALAVLLGWARGKRGPADESGQNPVPAGKAWADSFVLILVLWGAFLALFPEYFYLRDFFGSRMNTVFKFYFQAWAFLSVAAAYGILRLFGALKSSRAAAGGRRRAYAAAASGVVCLTLLLGSVYFPMAVYTKTNEAKYPNEPTLDAEAWLSVDDPADTAAVEWMKANLADNGPLVEAVGNDYDASAARISTAAGIPSILGWSFHEIQWRGDSGEVRDRMDDIEQLYKTTDWISAEEILAKYGVRYVYFGSLEQQRYGSRGLAKFRAHLKVVYETEDVVIFERVVS